jgi:hypothetical protein
VENRPEGVPLARVTETRFCYSLWLHVHVERRQATGDARSWKQIAGHLERSEQTVRRWEAAEGLPVYRRKHQKQDTVFAYTGEIEHWNRRRTRKLAPPDPALDATSPARTADRPAAFVPQLPLFSSAYLNVCFAGSTKTVRPLASRLVSPGSKFSNNGRCPSRGAGMVGQTGD